MSAKTFHRVTNKDIYDSVQSLHDKQDNMNTKIEIHEQKIGFLNKVVMSIGGVLSTIGVSILLFSITRGVS